VEIKTRSLFNKLIKNLTLEILEDEELDEITTTGDVAGYSTPFAFSSKSKKDRKKKLKRLKKSTGYVAVNEALDKKDVEAIKKVIRDVVGDVFRDIWLKRNSWK
tara:strand:+ start:158 stop:469 length:312 start_codon:yes stop_codon:yes gene_type:complete